MSSPNIHGYDAISLTDTDEDYSRVDLRLDKDSPETATLFTFDIPLLSLRSIEDQIDFLILSWVLFIHRTNGEDDGTAFHWAYVEGGPGTMSPSPVLQSSTRSVVQERDGRVISVLAAAQDLRKNALSLLKDASNADQHSLFFMNDEVQNPTSPVSLVQISRVSAML